MLPVKWSDNLKVSLIFLTNANFCMFVRCFRKILDAVTSPAFYNSYVTIPTHSTPLESYIADNPKFYPFFKGALGALDGTHISARPPASDRARYHNHKGGISQNGLAATTFDMQFCYILSGWEGSASDGGSFMMHMFMTWSFHLGSITLQIQAIPSVMLSWCHSMVFGITFGSGKAVVCSV